MSAEKPAPDVTETQRRNDPVNRDANGRFNPTPGARVKGAQKAPRVRKRNRGASAADALKRKREQEDAARSRATSPDKDKDTPAARGATVSSADTSEATEMQQVRGVDGKYAGSSGDSVKDKGNARPRQRARKPGVAVLPTKRSISERAAVRGSRVKKPGVIGSGDAPNGSTPMAAAAPVCARDSAPAVTSAAPRVPLMAAAPLPAFNPQYRPTGPVTPMTDGRVKVR